MTCETSPLFEAWLQAMRDDDEDRMTDLLQQWQHQFPHTPLGVVLDTHPSNRPTPLLLLAFSTRSRPGYELLVRDLEQRQIPLSTIIDTEGDVMAALVRCSNSTLWNGGSEWIPVEIDRLFKAGYPFPQDDAHRAIVNTTIMLGHLDLFQYFLDRSTPDQVRQGYLQWRISIQSLPAYCDSARTRAMLPYLEQTMAQMEGRELHQTLEVDSETFEGPRRPRL